MPLCRKVSLRCSRLGKDEELSTLGLRRFRLSPPCSLPFFFVPATFSPALNQPLPLLIDGTMCHIFVASITFHPLLGARPARKHEHKSNPRNSCPTLPNIPQTKSRTSPQDGLQFPSPRANRPSSQMQLPTWRTKTNALTPFNGVTLGHLSWIVHRNSRELCSVGSRILEDSCRC